MAQHHPSVMQVFGRSLALADLPRKGSPTRICYMVQGPACEPPVSRREAELSSAGRSLIRLAFNESCPGALFGPGVTWAEGRNMLYAETRRRHTDCAYFIFLDDDVHLRRVTRLTREGSGAPALTHRPSSATAVATSGDTWTAFEHFLRTWQPAVGSVYHDHACTNRSGCQRVGSVSSHYRMDHALLAVHAEAAEHLLPYNTSVEVPRCFYHPPAFMTAKAAALYPGHILRYEALDVGKQQHSRHSQSGACNFEWVYQQLLATLPARYVARVRKNKDYNEPYGAPLRKVGSYADV